MTQPRDAQVRAVAIMLASCVFFSGMATFAGAAHKLDPELGTAMASLFRAGVNVLLLIPLAGFSPRALIGDARPALWSRGVLGALSMLTYFGSLAHIGIGEAAFLNQTSAVWVAVAAPFVLGEPTRPTVGIAVAMSLLGMALMAHPNGDSAELFGRGLGVAAGIFAAGAYLSVRKAGKTNTPITVVFWFTAMGTVAAAALVLASGESLPRDPRVWLLLTGAGISATFGQLLMTTAYRDGAAALVAATGAAGPLITTIAGLLFLHQAVDGWSAAGMAVLLVSAVLFPFTAAGATAPAPAAATPPPR